MQQHLTERHAGLIAGLLAALAILAGLWHAAYRAPEGVWQSATAASEPAVAPPDATQHWTVRPLQVSDGRVVASETADRPGFDVGNCTVPLEHLYDLPAARDEVQALAADTVHVVAADQAQWLEDDDPVFGLQLYGHARCYPRNLLARHNLVNDRLGGEPILLWFDPPSGACMAFRRPMAAGTPLNFATSGIGYGGTALPYDRQTESLWSALGSLAVGMGEPLSGPARDQRLRLRHVSAETMTWAAWRKLWPGTTVMSLDTGHDHDYSFDPYTRVLGPDGQAMDYYHSDLLLAPEWLLDDTRTMPDKAEVLGVLLPDGPLAVPVTPALAAAAEGEHTLVRESDFGQLRLVADATAQRLYLTMPGSVRPPQTRLFWFAWRWSYPQTRLWQVDAQASQLPVSDGTSTD